MDLNMDIHVFPEDVQDKLLKIMHFTFNTFQYHKYTNYKSLPALANQ